MNVNEKDEEGAPLSMMTARIGNRRIAEILILKGARVLEKDKKGNTPFDYVDSSDKAMRDLLRKYSGMN